MLAMWNKVEDSDNEAMIRNKISSWLTKSGIDYMLEHPTPAGPVDLHLLHRHCIIEVKTPKKMGQGPFKPGTGSRSKESAYDQLDRYIHTVHSQTELMTDSPLPWRGIVTDGQRWWIWEWPSAWSADPPKIYGAWEGRKLTDYNFTDLISVLKRDAVGKPWPPSDPGKLKNMFDGILDQFDKSYKLNKKLNNTKIQKYLWLEQLKASGLHPDSGSEDELFVKHTLLILTSRFISGMHVPPIDDRINAPLLEGFVGWTRHAREDLKALHELINSYNWSGNQTDVMRSLYMTIIPKEQRKLYGEYYTPDWLAEMICDDVIDDTYIQSQVTKFMAGDDTNGILDPACGSGTFLYSAAKRLLKSDAVKKSGMNKQMQIDFVCNMLHGVDILPVAVEMAIANMTRILGGLDPSRLRIHQGDSLLASRTTATVHGTLGDVMTLYVDNTPITLPYAFLERVEAISLFVTTAREGQRMPAILAKNLGKKSKKILQDTHKTLTDVISRRGNGVWAWYIKNQAAPLLLSKGTPVARIITNPPWLRKNYIMDKSRQKLIEQLATDAGVFQGGKMAPNLDLAAVFVARADGLYLDSDGKAAWVLPDTAMNGAGQWEKLRNIFGDRLGTMWDMNTLPFPNHGRACVMLIGSGTRGRILTAVQYDKSRPAQYDAWHGVASNMIKLEDMKAGDAGSDDILTPEKCIASEWAEHNMSAIRQGTTLVPHVLVRVDPDSMKTGGGGRESKTAFTTNPSRHGVWRTMDCREGLVPSYWIRSCLIGKDLLPFCVRTDGTPFVIPLDKHGQWLKERTKNIYWKEACEIYSMHKGKGGDTPPTLEKRLNHHDALYKQVNKPTPFVVYNTSGTRLYASVVKNCTIIDSSLYSVACNTVAAADFLCGILNSDVLQDALAETKRAYKHYHTYYWKKIPIPLFNRNNNDHKSISILAGDALTLAQKVLQNDKNIQRKSLLAKIRNSGIMTKLDDVVTAVLPEYTRSA